MNAAQTEVALPHVTYTPTKVEGASHWVVTIRGKVWKLSSGKPLTVPA